MVLMNETREEQPFPEDIQGVVQLQGLGRKQVPLGLLERRYLNAGIPCRAVDRFKVAWFKRRWRGVLGVNSGNLFPLPELKGRREGIVFQGESLGCGGAAGPSLRS